MKNIAEPKHVFEMRLITIETQFGENNLDDCVEEVQAIIDQFFGSADFQMQVDWDISHYNPYFHTLYCVVKGIDSVTAGLVKNDLIKQGLID